MKPTFFQNTVSTIFLGIGIFLLPQPLFSTTKESPSPNIHAHEFQNEIAADTNEISLSATIDEIEVRALESQSPLRLQPAAISQIEAVELQSLNPRTVASAFNFSAGATIEERATASYRVNIRGSSLRSPFGVRNVKVYWNGFSFTTSEGTTPLNFLDISLINNATVLKGPSGSLYGAGNGGVMLLNNQPQNRNSVQVSASGGSYNLQRQAIQLNYREDHFSIHSGYSQMSSDGYRNHSGMDRKNFFFSSSFFPSASQKIDFHLLYVDLFYQLPGGLTLEQFQENPRLARPNAAEQNSSIETQMLFAGISAEHQLSSNWMNRTYLSMSTIDFDHPFILDYKTELQREWAGRTVFYYDGLFGNQPVRLALGAEYQNGRKTANNFANIGGSRDSLRFADDIRTTNASTFQQLEWKPGNGWLITAALSQNFTRYQVDRYADNIGSGPWLVKRSFDPVWVPRIGFSKELGDRSVIYSLFSAGFSPPTLDEFRTNEGSVNLDLEAERGWNYEVGYRFRDRNEVFQANLSVFYFNLDQTISTFTNPDGVALFRNSGATDQYGIELEVDWRPYNSDLGFLREIELRHAYTGHFFYFRESARGEEDISGNKLTGVAPHKFSNRLSIQFAGGFQWQFYHLYSDRLPLDDRNMVFQEARHVFGTKIDWNNQVGDQWKIKAGFGIENLTDLDYSLGNDLNAFGGRFYQSAPGRNWYVDLGVGYLF